MFKIILSFTTGIIVGKVIADIIQDEENNWQPYSQ